jgi:UDP-N-acetyl-2-amino-2-deoxyglucuronate dehydrogenase
MSVSVRFGVVGCGSIGSRHLAIVAAEPRAHVTTVCDVDQDALARVSRPGVRACSDFSELLDDSEVDVVTICTPHALHAEMAVDAAEAGKHVLVEKPMALSSRDARRCIEAARANNIILSVVKQNRYNVPVVLAKRALDEGWLGRVFMVQCAVLWNRSENYYAQSPWRGRRELEGGALYTQASHFMDLLNWWFGPVVSAQAQVATRNHTIEIEDCGTALLQFDSGVMGSLAWTTCVYNRNYEGSITIIGEFGTIKIGGRYLNTIESWDVAGRPMPSDVECSDRPNVYPGYEGSSSNHDRVIQDMVAAVLKERAAAVDGNAGLLSIEAIELVYQSAATGLAARLAL